MYEFFTVEDEIGKKSREDLLIDEKLKE